MFGLEINTTLYALKKLSIAKGAVLIEDLYLFLCMLEFIIIVFSAS